jgi:hypothetical protein
MFEDFERQQPNAWKQLVVYQNEWYKKMDPLSRHIGCGGDRLAYGDAQKYALFHLNA